MYNDRETSCKSQPQIVTTFNDSDSSFVNLGQSKLMENEPVGCECSSPAAVETNCLLNYNPHQIQNNCSLISGYLRKNTDVNHKAAINNEHNMAGEGRCHEVKQQGVNSLETVNNLPVHDAVDRQLSASSLCSWNSFDTSVTDDNLSDDEGDGTKCTSISLVAKGKLWGKVRKAIRWSPFVQSYKKKYPWIQLAGHDGAFKAGEKGTILKKAECNEIKCLHTLMTDVLRPYVPEFKGQIEDNGECYTEMQDLLQEFDSPCVMDCKMGIRTYLEAELFSSGKQPKQRTDLYNKMITTDPTEPTEDENAQKAITKPRYMQWREQLSSTATLGFRIEGIKSKEQKPSKEFKTTKTKQDIGKVFSKFVSGREDLQQGYLQKLKAIRATLETSPFFSSHEVIGNSLLFVHDSFGNTGVWLIDFGKTTQLPLGETLNHRDTWEEGNREDGYLFGLDNMIDIWQHLKANEVASSSSSP